MLKECACFLLSILNRIYLLFYKLPQVQNQILEKESLQINVTINKIRNFSSKYKYTPCEVNYCLKLKDYVICFCGLQTFEQIWLTF